MIRLTKEGGCDIAASGKEQMGGAVCRLGVCCRKVGDMQALQGGFIVSGILFVTKDGDGWAFGHEGFLRFLVLLYGMQIQDFGG